MSRATTSAAGVTWVWCTPRLFNVVGVITLSLLTRATSSTNTDAKAFYQSSPLLELSLSTSTPSASLFAIQQEAINSVEQIGKHLSVVIARSLRSTDEVLTGHRRMVNSVSSATV
ncbi:hypothetical protein LZ32DRAFT_117615 [Colletotrichum eremochloae]|nr:hypothetical protein LZ32DRAFT_117615 [Colletotrichum eremochloae]